MRVNRLGPRIEKVGAIFQEAPPAVSAAWEAHRPYALRALKMGEAEGFIVTLLALQRAVRRAVGRECGYFTLDEHLFGYGGFDYDPKWTVILNSSPVRGGGPWTSPSPSSSS
jgi:hypothetical protein